MGEPPSFRIAHSPFFLLSAFCLAPLACSLRPLSRAPSLPPSLSLSLSRPYSSETRFYYYYSSFLLFSFFFLIPQVNHLLPLFFPHIQPIVPLSAITLASSYCPFDHHHPTTSSLRQHHHHHSLDRPLLALIFFSCPEMHGRPARALVVVAASLLAARAR